MAPPSAATVEAAEEAADAAAGAADEAAAAAAESAAAYERLVRILFAVGWRSSKATVDLALPSQSFVTHDLECAFDTCAMHVHRLHARTLSPGRRAHRAQVLVD